MTRHFFKLISVLAVVGIIASALSLEHHYRRDASSFCNINDTFNCDVVNRSRFSEILGIPVAGIGLLGYVGMLYLALLQDKKPETAAFLMFLTGAGFTFSLYLTYIEGSVLDTWCVLCLTSLAAITCMFVLSLLRVRADSQHSRA